MKTVGSIETAPLECINPRLQKYRVRWAFEPHYNKDGKQDGVMFDEAEVLHKPTLEEVKEIVIAGYDAVIADRIVNGFVWSDTPVKLSIADQMNYKSLYDTATGEITCKFGTATEPVYYTFATKKDYNEFYAAIVDYIRSVREAGWKEKDALDWIVYGDFLAARP